METTGHYRAAHSYVHNEALQLLHWHHPEYFLLMETIEPELVSVQWVAECVVVFVFGRQNEL